MYPAIAAAIFFIDAQEKRHCLFLLAEYLLIIALPLTNTQALRDADSRRSYFYHNDREIPKLAHIEESIHVAVPPTVIDQIWSEVDRWHLWDPDTKQARLNGPFAAGTQGRIVPNKGMGIPMLVTERSAGRSFTVEGYIPLFRIHFEHTVAAVDGGAEVVHRVWFTGALAFLFGPGVARQVRQGLPKTMRSLKAYAEKRHATLHDGEVNGANATTV